MENSSLKNHFDHISVSDTFSENYSILLEGYLEQRKWVLFPPADLVISWKDRDNIAEAILKKFSMIFFLPVTE